MLSQNMYANDNEFVEELSASIAAAFFPYEELHCFGILVEMLRLGR